MASVFRIRIAKRVLSTIEESISRSLADGSDAISQLLRVKRFGRNLPQFALPWEKLLNVRAELKQNYQPSDLVTALKDQGLPNTDGVTEISFDNSPPSSIVFTMDGRIFTKAILMDLCVNLDMTSFKSVYFQKIAPQDILVDFSSSEVGRPIGMGHFRSAIHGNFIANINQYVGHNVKRVCSIDDWGLKCALILAGYDVFGIEDQLQRNPNFHLFEVLKASYEKYKADDEFKEKAKLYHKGMQENDEKITSLWNKLRDPCLQEFIATYQFLGIKFDEIHGDSMFSNEVMDIEKEIIDKQLMEDLTGLESQSISVKEKDGFYSPTYGLARNIGAAMFRKNMFGFDQMYYVANSSKKYYFSLLFDALREMGHDWYSTLRHVRLKDIKSFESGRNKELEISDVLHQAKIDILKDIKQQITPNIASDVDDIAGQLSKAALIVNDMQHRKNREYSFNLADSLRVKENSGISLQLCHAALTELLESTDVKFKFDADTSPLTEAEAINLVRHLSRFDEIIYKAYYTLEPCIILQYLFTLSYFVEKAVPVLTLSVRTNRLTAVKARLLLFHTTQKVFRKGLELLGIEPLERF